MRRHRPMMHVLRQQIRPLQGNPGLPGGIMQPSVAWLESNCAIEPHDYGNGNVQYVYTCDHLGGDGHRYRCRWARWSNSNAIQLLDCNDITQGHYHDSHGAGEGPQGFTTPSTPPWQPFVDESLSLNYGRVRLDAQPYHYGRWASRNPEGGQTPVCPVGTEVCGDPLPGHAPPCCPIKVQGPTPASASRHRGMRFRDRMKLTYRLLLGR